MYYTHSSSMHNCIYGFFTLCEMIVWIYFFISFQFHFFGEWNLFLKQMILQFGFSLHFFWSLDFYAPHFILNRMDLSFWNKCRSILIATMIGETIIIIIILLFLLALSLNSSTHSILKHFSDDGGGGGGGRVLLLSSESQ